VPANLELILLGAPTHTSSLPRERAERLGLTGSPTGAVRRWIETATPPTPPIRLVTFDTAFLAQFGPSTAAQTAVRALRMHGFRDVRLGESFHVVGLTGPLLEGEEDRARAWGRRLARDL